MVKTKVPGHKFNPKKDSFFRKTATKQNITTSGSFFVKSIEKPPIERDSFLNKSKRPRNTPPVRPSEQSNEEEAPTKKPFDKKKWRENKYNLKTKVDKWKSKRVTHLRHEYFKQKDRSSSGSFDVQKIYEEEEKRQNEDPEDNEDNGQDAGELEAFSRRTRRQWKKDQSLEEKEQARKEFLQRKLDKEVALEKYRKKKLEKHKKLNMKTKRGQPVMKGRMELLLEQIQERMNS